MKIKIIIEGQIKKPKIGDGYCDYGLDGRSGYFEVPIKNVFDDFIIVGDNKLKVPIKKYAYKTLMNKLQKKVKVIIL